MSMETEQIRRKLRQPRFVVYQDQGGQWRWRLLAANSRIVADSGESYTRHADCLRAVRQVRAAFANAA